MIIDCHTHIGCINTFHMPAETLLASQKKYNIDFVLTSNIEGTEVNISNEISSTQFSQFEINTKVLNLAKNHSNKIGALVWAKPSTEGCNESFKNLVAKNIHNIYGIKIHPFFSKLPFTDQRIIDYLEFAKKINLPIVTHTSNDIYSHPQLVLAASKIVSGVDIVLYHLGLGTDNDDAINIIRDNNNLYGDVSWVKPEKILKAIQKCGSNKIMFGTDSPINGIDTYNDVCFYDYCFNELNKDISEIEYNNFMSETSKKVFKINIAQN